MRVARYGPVGQERPALVADDGTLRDASAIVSDIDVAALAALHGVAPEKLPIVAGNPRLGIPFTGTRKFIAIGLNYRDHAAEAGLPLPTEPVIFMKAISCLSGPQDDVPLPRGSTKMDWEIELGIVIGTVARYVEAADALAHVAGYVLVNDLTEREDQMERGGTWDKGKGHDGFGPVGPYLVTTDELGDAATVSLTLAVNGRRFQDGNTAAMICKVQDIVAYVSRFMTLEPGDIITTGTPAGVGIGIKPDPVYLRVGDALVGTGTRLGEQRFRIAPPPGQPQ